MTNTKSVRRRQQGRIFPEFTIPPEELARREAERNARGEKARLVFNRVRPELINDHYKLFSCRIKSCANSSPNSRSSTSLLPQNNQAHFRTPHQL
jgi:hypothetical protein